MREERDLLLCASTFADVDADRDRPDDLVVPVQAAFPPEDVALFARLGQDRVLGPDRNLPGGEALELLPDLGVAIPGRQDLEPVLPFEVLTRVAGELFKGAVDKLDLTLAAQLYDNGVGSLEQILRELAGLVRVPLGLLALGDVLDDRDQAEGRSALVARHRDR